MKNFSIKSLVVLPLSLGLFFTSCKRYSSDFGDTNVNPGATTKPILSALLTNVEAGVGGYAASTRNGLYCQYFSETQYTDASLYSLPQADFEGRYNGALNDLQNIINTNESNNMSQVARILKAYIFSQTTDVWGDVPYSQALTGNKTPAFDAQKAVYEGCITELTQAVAAFDALSGIKGDIIFSGDVTKWKKFANSLRMRLALQLSKRYPAAGAYAAVQFNAALNDAAGYITSNADNFALTYPGGSFKNPWYSVYDGRKDYGESDQMVALLGGLSDGRQDAYGSSTLGVPYGRVRAFVDPWCQANPSWSRILAESKRPEAGTVVMLSAAEVFLSRAEAADRGWTSENVSSLFQSGVNASFAQWNLTAPNAGYFAQPGTTLAAQGTGANVTVIAKQAYIAGYPDGTRGWNIWRRTGVPTLVPAVDATNSTKQIPRRYTYGQSSYGSNTAAVTAAVANMGGDTQDTKVWWDQ
jgi:hypothetical protein